MKTLTVALPGREYDILIERGLLAQAGERIRAVLPRASKLAVVTDTNVAPLYLEQVVNSLQGAGFQTAFCAVPAGESSKCVRQLSRPVQQTALDQNVIFPARQSYGEGLHTDRLLFVPL